MSTLILVILLLAVICAGAAAAVPERLVRLLAASVALFELGDFLERLGRG